MKFNILLLTLIITQSANAERICANYITDEWPNSRYTNQEVSGDKVVIDNKTDLMWKHCVEGLSGLDCLEGSASVFTWKLALDLAVDINNNSGFAGYNDWRVPNIEELRSIAAINCYAPAINETAFPNTPVDFFITSSPVTGLSFSMWVLSFYFGDDDAFNRGDSGYRLRLVRSTK